MTAAAKTNEAEAMRLAQLGFKVFPCREGHKTPMTANGFHDATSDMLIVRQWWKRWPFANIAIATEGLFVVDVDGASNEWPTDPDMKFDVATAAVSVTPSGGRHYVFRQPVGGSFRCSTGVIAPKVDTRADGGYIIVAPSAVNGNRYEWRGDGLDCRPDELAVVPDSVLKAFADGKASKDKSKPRGEPVPSGPIGEGGRNDTLTRIAGGLRRQGMGEAAIAAALHATNAERCVPPLPDSEVDKIAASVARYEPDFATVAVVEDTFGREIAGGAFGQMIEQANAEIRKPKAEPKAEPEFKKREALPEHFMSVPGFVSQVMDYTLSTQKHPNRIMSFAGALALLSTLTARKIRDPNDARTNLYIIGLAYSGAGKDGPRKVNKQILKAVGMDQSLGEDIASGEGLQDAIADQPVMLFQTDEIDAMLSAIGKSKDGRMERFMSSLLTLYSSSDSSFGVRRKAGDEGGIVVEQPSLTIFGTATPKLYYESLTERMIAGGFFSRTMIFETGTRSPGREPGIPVVPDALIAAAKYWADFRPGSGNLDEFFPEPIVVPYTSAAEAIFIEKEKEYDRRWAKAERREASGEMAIWSRIDLQSRKLALLYAASANAEDPRIDEAAAEWASGLAEYLGRRMLAMATEYTAETDFERKTKRVLKAIKKGAKGKPGTVSRAQIMRNLNFKAAELDDVVKALYQSERIAVVDGDEGRPGIWYETR